MTDTVDIRPGSDFSIAQIATCFNEAFADYFGHPIVWTPSGLAEYLPHHCISQTRSLVACPRGSDTPVGFALMAYRDDLPGHARLAGMGVVPSWAGRGVGSRLLAAVVDAARADGTATLWLEVITQNAPAAKLYARHGFTVVRALAGWTRDAGAAAEDEPAAALEDRAPDEVLRLLRRYGAAADLPWQLWHQFALATRPQSCRGFRLGRAWCAVSDPDDESKDAISLLGAVVEPDEEGKEAARGTGQATALLRAVMARYPGRKWKAPATFPLEYGETIARRLGFEKETICMDLMKLNVE
ncbi:acetyltransferase, gnat family [Cordyceps militaris CM01]|uniref:Acetyltransferase, gnat family n=1 Tax=Cordyceps militaris (strain CM01) TaxID=983644 RepID=G3J2J1_CORMM|nr:acetyltransferase, gnat family [Cordyceps militaris CM01]EGX95527.1 acetyltransferase, gnat family [Cordyceps militaris CM01]